MNCQGLEMPALFDSQLSKRMQNKKKLGFHIAGTGATKQPASKLCGVQAVGTAIPLA